MWSEYSMCRLNAVGVVAQVYGLRRGGIDSSDFSAGYAVLLVFHRPHNVTKLTS
jgi:hypothetical protein